MKFFKIFIYHRNFLLKIKFENKQEKQERLKKSILQCGSLIKFLKKKNILKFFSFFFIKTPK